MASAAFPGGDPYGSDYWYYTQGSSAGDGYQFPKRAAYNIHIHDYSSQILNANDCDEADYQYYDFSNGEGARLYISGGITYPYRYYSIGGLRGFSEITLSADHNYVEDTPVLSTEVLPITYTENDVEKTKAIPIKYFCFMGNLSVEKPLQIAAFGETDTDMYTHINPYYGRVVTLLKLKNYYDGATGKYVGLSDNCNLSIGRRTGYIYGGFEDTIISVDSTEKRDYTINDAAATVTTRKGLVTHDEMVGTDKYSYINSLWNATAEITFGQNLKWNTTSPTVSKSVGDYDAGNYSEANINLENLTFDSVTPNSTITLFNGSGLNHVNYANLTTPTNYTWTVSNDGNNTKSWIANDIDQSVAGGGISVTGKRDDTITSTVTGTDSSNQNWTVKYSASEADIKAIEATSSDGGIRLTEDGSTLLKLVGDYKISSDFSPFRNEKTHIIDAHHLANNRTITLVDFSEAKLTETDWSHLIMDQNNHNNNIHHSAVDFETGDNKAVVVTGKVGADIYKDGNTPTEYALKAKLGDNIAQYATIDMSKIGSDSSTQEPWKNNGTLYTITEADGYTQDYSANKVKVTIKNSSATKSSDFKNGETMTLLNIQGKNADANATDNDISVDGNPVVQFADSQYGVTVNGANKGQFKVATQAAQGNQAASYSVSYTAGENIVQQDKGVVLGELQTDNATADKALLTAEEGQYVLDGTVTVDVSDMSIKGKALAEGTKIKIADLSKAETRNNGHLEFASETNTRSLRASNDSSRYRETVASFEETEYTKGVKASGSQDFAMEISDNNVITGEAGKNEITAIALSDIDVADIRSFGDISSSAGKVSVTDGSDEASRITLSNYAINSSSATLTNNTGANSFNGWTFNETGSTTLNDAKVNDYSINLLKNKNSEAIDTDNRTAKTGTFKGTIGSSVDVVGATYTDKDLLKAAFKANKITANENSHYGVQASAANAIAITNGTINAANVAGSYLSGFLKDGEEGDTCVFGNIGGTVTRTNTGSHVSENMWNAVAGVGKRTKLNNGSTFGYGVFYEGGHGNYTSHNDRADITGLSGRLHFDGVGALLRYETPSKAYGEMGLHVGRVGNKSQHMGLDKSASYWGFSLGGGRFIDMDEKSNLDVYAKFYFNRTGSMNFTAQDKMDYNLDAVTSKQLRIGARYNHSLNDRSKLYAGLAYAYEFGGQARGTVGVGGLSADIRPASLRGGSGILELGYKLEATKNNPWEIDLGLTGFAGAQKGFGANLGVKYHF